MTGPVIAIDGPAGSGKSTTARLVAERLGVPHLDTGAFYRAVTLACLRAGVDLEDGQACGAIASGLTITRQDGRTLLDGEDVEEEIRGPAVTGAVSTVAAHPSVRTALVPLQRAAASTHGGVVEGRDIGSVVLPDADLKVFLDADVEERARRRLAEQGGGDLAAMVADVEARDRADRERDMSPLVAAEDAWHLDTTGLDPDEVVDAIVARVGEVVADSDPIDDRHGRSDAEPGPPSHAGARFRGDRVVIVGRPNVGKSTLVNRILGRRVAIVEHKPGVTRDRTEHAATWNGRDFTIVDTGGWARDVDGLAARVADIARDAAIGADLVLFVVDVTVGAQEDDERFARELRRHDVPTFLVVNKVDGARHEADAHVFHALGLGEPMTISAAHGRGVADLLDAVVRRLGADSGTPTVGADTTRIPRVALVGKPNVGKSSLFNRLLGEERSLVDAVPHTTRDPVDTTVTIDGRTWTFIDTAGMRRRHRHGEATEYYSVDRTLRAIDDADLALFLIDGSDTVSEQDQRLAAALRDAGCGLVLVVNKWDLVDAERAADLERELDRLLSFASWAPRINISATSGRGLRRVLPTLATVWESYNRRIPTRLLNRLVEELVERTPPPLVHRRPLKIRYVTQAETAPPRFVAFTNADIPAAYRRYLLNQLRERHDFTGTPLVLEERRGSGRSARPADD
ncbi:MAG: ribosome biogenesis GTPase Der [Nitriliruptorales bacterium]|nr:ribosome biogenesis GTPase Der [Nitriliruptorales bacterium]